MALHEIVYAIFTQEIFSRNFIPQLLENLPMDQVTFLAELQVSGILLVDLKNELRSMPISS